MSLFVELDKMEEIEPRQVPHFELGIPNEDSKFDIGNSSFLHGAVAQLVER